MIKKITNKLKNIINKELTENKYFLIFLAVFLILFSIKTDYRIYNSGGSSNITSRINKENNLKKTKGSLNIAFVSALDGRLPFYLIAKILPSWDLVKNEDVAYAENETMEDVKIRDHIYYEETNSVAKELGYIKSNTKYTKENIVYHIIYVDPGSKSKLKIGDQILSYDNISYTGIDNLAEYTNTKKVNDEINFLVKRDKKEIKIPAKIYSYQDRLITGIITIETYDIISDTQRNIKSKTNENGPSGGLILSLAIYNSLVKEDITKGNKIIGTGTIDINGNVGEIGGIKYKLAGAVKDKADLFIVPNENLKEALKIKKEKKYNINIKGVSTFDEALSAIQKLEEK